jgi:hypothetical protein
MTSDIRFTPYQMTSVVFLSIKFVYIFNCMHIVFKKNACIFVFNKEAFNLVRLC